MQTRVADFAHEGRRIVAFLDEDPAGPNRWPEIAERYAQEHGIALNEARWYNVHARRFANGRSDVNEFLPNNRSWNFETNLTLSRAIIQRFGLDPETLPLDL